MNKTHVDKIWNIKLNKKDLWEAQDCSQTRCAKSTRPIWTSSRAGGQATLPTCSDIPYLQVLRGHGPLQIDHHQARIWRCEKLAQMTASERRCSPDQKKEKKILKETTKQPENLHMQPQAHTRKQGGSTTPGCEFTFPSHELNYLIQKVQTANRTTSTYTYIHKYTYTHAHFPWRNSKRLQVPWRALCHWGCKFKCKPFSFHHMSDSHSTGRGVIFGPRS